MAIAADGHGAPAAAMRAGIIVEEEATGGVGTAADGCAWAFDEEFGSGASDGRQEPVQSTFTGDELERPIPFMEDQFIMAFGDAEDLVDWLDPGGREGLVIDDAAEDGAERFTKAKNAEEDGVHRLRLTGYQGTQAGGTIFGDKAGIDEESDKLAPREIAG